MLKALMSVRLRALAAGLVRPKKGKGERTKGATAGILILAVFVVASLLTCLFMLSYSLGSFLLPLGKGWLYFGILSSLAFLLSVFGSFMTAKAQLFDSKDNDILLPMPIPPSVILLSRMISLILTAFLYILAVLLPGGIVYCLFLPLDAGASVGLLFGTLSITLLSVTVSSVFGYLFALASSFFKNKSLVAVIATLLFFGVYILLYSFLFSVDMENTTAVQEFVLRLEDIFRGTPLRYVGEVFIGSPIPLLCAVLISSVLFLLLVALLSRGFFRVSAGGVSAKRKRETAVTWEAHSLRRALLKKDISFLFHHSTYLINSCLGPILLILLSGFLFIAGGGFYQGLLSGLLAAGAESGEIIPLSEIVNMLVIPGVTLVLCVIVGAMTTVTAASVSVEAKTLWLLQSLPVRPLDLLLSKVYLQLTVTLPPLLLAVIAAAVSFGLPFYIALLIFLAAAAFSYLSAMLGLMMNLLLPKFDAISIGHAAKQSVSVLITIFTMMLLAVLLLVPAFILVPLSSPAVYLLVLTAVVLLLSAWPTWYLLKKGTRRFAGFSV